MFVELVEKDIKKRNTIVPIGNVGIIPADYCRYISLFPFDKTIIDYINVHGTIKGHKGIHYSPYIIFDIDNDTDLESCRKSAIELCNRLEQMFEIYPDDLRIYFSGNKGFHILLHENLYGKLQPSNDIAEKIKKFVINVTEGIDNIDTVIYENHRLIRVAHSKYEKSGLYKISVHYDEIAGTVEQILTLAKTPRPDFIAKRKITELVKKDKLVKYIADLKKIDIYNTDFENNTEFFTPPVSGERNSKLHKQACALFINTPFKRESIVDILQSINIASGNPIPLTELNTLCKNAEFFAKTQPQQVQELDVRSFGEWIPEFIESIREEENKITLCFDSFDTEMKGKLKGKLLSLIGYGGSKKSLYSANICFQNIMKNNYRCLYSSMEMGSSEIMKRFIDMAAIGDEYNVSFELELAERKNKGVTEKFIQQYLIPIYTDKLYITQNSAMTADKYREILLKLKVETGNFDILVVDGLGMMGGQGEIKEIVSKNSKELKELAKDFNIFVIMITHAARGEDKAHKDLSRKARDSEKIMDNCDFYITLSQIYENKTEEKIFEKNGVARLVNKRGSGKNVEVYFEVDQKQLILKEISAINLVEAKKTWNNQF
jgi:hypothetical protein